MKRYIKTAISLGLILILFACNGMDNPPTDKYTDTNFWTSIDKAQNMLNMAYNQLYGAGRMWNEMDSQILVLTSLQMSGRECMRA